MPTIPEDYHRHVLDAVERSDEHLVISYGGKIFGGIVVDLLASDAVRDAVKPGAEIIVRYHTADTGQEGQIAHVLIAHPAEPGWAELYADWE